MTAKTRLFLILCTLAFASSCATKNHLENEYKESLNSAGNLTTSDRTVVIILIDGLPVATLKTELEKRHLSHIQRYFRIRRGQVPMARTSFPSLTFPGIGALLMERPIDQTGIYGNSILHDGETLDFESPLNYPRLNNMFAGQNIYSRLRAKGLKSISVEYSFDANSDAHMERGDTQAALSIQNRDYEFVDTKLTTSLTQLLKNTETQRWPDFIFLHLIGLDLTSHNHGANSPEARKYLNFLDQKLGNIFSVLEKTETSQKRKIQVLLTADHGFDRNMLKFSNLEEAIHGLDPRIKTLNEGRYLGLFFPQDWPASKIEILMDEFTKNPSIDIVAAKQGNEILVQSNAKTKRSSSNLSSKLIYQPGTCAQGSFMISISGSESRCPEKLEASLNQLYYPYFLSNISHYFRAPNAPDAIIISQPGVSFRKGSIGAHGGPTPQEIFVPLLMHNCVLADPLAVPELSELLGFL